MAIEMEATSSTSVPKMKKDKKEKKEKRKLEAPETEAEVKTEVESSAPVEESKEERRARKKAKKLAKESAVDETAKVEEAVAMEETKEERKARRKAEKLAKSLAEDETNVAESSNPAAASTDEPKKVKKSKKEKTIQDPLEADVPVTNVPDDEVALKKKAKKEKKRAAYEAANPPKDEAAGEGSTSKSAVFQDETLSDQAKKAMYYVELHAATHAKLQAVGERWKFNKARQGWLMRNVWNDTEIPEAYFEKVVFYLKTLPGLARKGMIETAKKHANAPVPGAESVPAQTTEEESVEPKTEAAPVAEESETVIESKEPKGDTTPAAEEEEEKESDDPAQIEMRRERAQKILKALGAR